MSEYRNNENKTNCLDLISIVVPVYNEELTITRLIDELKRILTLCNSSGYCFELILVNDGSTDSTWKEIETLSLLNDSEFPDFIIKGLSFSRNFGKEAAILAGLACSKGGAVITIDADLQHPPEKIPEFIGKWEQGAKVVEGIKIGRGKEKPWRGFFSRVFYDLMSRVVGNDLSNTSDYKLLDRTVVDVILRMPEKQMFYRAITSWIGFETARVEYEVQERALGNSKWSPWKLFLYAIRNITSFSTAPMQLITICAFFFMVLGIYEGIMVIINLVNGTAIEGFATVILLQLISGGIIMLALGLIGYYLAKLIDDTKGRPRYIIENSIEKSKQSTEVVSGNSSYNGLDDNDK